MIWTDERVAQLKALYFDTHIEWSFSQIAEKLGGGLSRNAVIGKAHRLGLERRRTGAKPGVNRNGLARKPTPTAVNVQKINAARAAPEVKPGVNRNGLARKPTPTAVNVQKINAARAAPEVKPEPFVMACVEVEPLNISMMDLTDETCRYPFGDDPATMTFCGLLPDGGPYCAGHARIAFQPRQTRKPLHPAEFGKARGGVFGRVA